MSEPTTSESLPGDADQQAVTGADPALPQPRTRRKRKSEDAAADNNAVDRSDSEDDEDKGEKRGPLSPAQFDDDGWGDTPAQMRG